MADQHVQRGFHIPSLDGLRAVAFAIVFASHGLSERVPGGFGVTIFFFLSGYLITTLLRQEHAKTGTISLSRFYARRALRILPNFYLVVAVATLLALAGVIDFVGGQFSGLAVLLQAVHLNNYYGIFRGDYGTAAGTGVLWSLAVEEHFYLLFPALYLILVRLTSRPAIQAGVLIALCALVLIWRCVISLVLSQDFPSDLYTYKASDARFDSLLMGCALAIVGNPVLDRSRFSERFWMLIATPLATAALLCTFLIRHDIFRETVRYTFQSLLLMPIFIAAIRCHRWPMFAWLEWPLVRYVGVLTYTLYLVHLVILVRLQQAAGPSTTGRWLAAAIALVLSLAIAIAVHHGIERPLAHWRKRLHRERPVPVP